MGALRLQKRELLTGPIVIEWSADAHEPHCEASGDIIVVDTDRCFAHAGAKLSCVFEWRMPPECEHEGLDLEDLAHPRCLLCGARGTEATEKWLKRMTLAAQGFDSYEEVIALGEVVGDDHSSRLTPEAS
jgi:hypothetical protein